VLTPIEQVLQRPKCGLQEPSPPVKPGRIPALYGLDQEKYAPKEKEKHLYNILKEAMQVLRLTG
jgi:hypothetical protein